MGSHKRTVRQRLFDMVDLPIDSDACWLWKGATAGGTAGARYGCLTFHKKKWYAHRLAYDEFFGPISEDFEVTHTCDNSLCINPRHLKLLLHKDNIADRQCKGRGRGGPNAPQHKLRAA